MKNPTKETPCGNTQMGARGIQRNERLEMKATDIFYS